MLNIQDAPLAPLAGDTLPNALPQGQPAAPGPIADAPPVQLDANGYEVGFNPPGEPSPAPAAPAATPQLDANGYEVGFNPPGAPSPAPTPEDTGKLKRLFAVQDKTAEEIANDKSPELHDLHAIFSENEDSIDQGTKEKLARADTIRRAQSLTPEDVGKGLVEGGKGFLQTVKGLNSVLKGATLPGPVGEAITLAKKYYDIHKRMEDTGESFKEASDKLDKQARAEVTNGIESMAVNWGSTARSGIRKAVNNPELFVAPGTVGQVLHDIKPEGLGKVQGDITDPTHFLSPADEVKSFVADAAVKRQQAQIASGQGAISEAIGLGKDELAKQGITLNPENIAGWATATDPMTWLPAVSALKVVEGANGGYQAVTAAGKIVAMAPASEPLAKMIQAAAARVATGLDKSANTLSKVAGLRSYTPPVAILGLLSGGLSTAAVVKAAAIKTLGQFALRAGEELASTVATPTASRAIAETIYDAGRAAKSVAQGAAGGAAFTLPFAAAMDDKRDAVASMTGGALIGATAALAHSAPQLVENGAIRAKEIALAARWQTGGKLAPVKAAVFNTPGMEKLENAHAELRAKLLATNPQEAYRMDLMRAGMKARAGGVEAYLMTPEQAKALNPALTGKEGVAKISITDANGKPQDVMAWVVRPGKTIAGLTHEPGHFIFDNVATPEEQAALLASFSDKQVAAFQELYASSKGLTPEQRAERNNPETARKELAAEAIGHIMEGSGLAGTAPTFRKKIGGILTSLMERVGAYDPTIQPGEAAPAEQHVTRYGTEQSHESSKLAENIFNKFAADPEVNAAMKELASGSAKPVPAVPEAGKPATPAAAAKTPQEVAYEAMPKGSFEKGVADSLFNKLKKGPLNARDEALWKQIFPGVEIPGTTPSATPPPIPTPAATPPPIPGATPAATPPPLPTPEATPPPLPVATPAATPPPLPVIQPRPEPVVTISERDPGTPPPLPEVKPLQPELAAPEIKPVTPQATPAATPPPLPTPEVKPPNIRGQTTASYTPFGGVNREPAQERVKNTAEHVAADPSLSPEVKAANKTLFENTGKPVEIVYDSAAETGSTRAESYKLRRVEVEAARNDPGLRAAATKLGVIPLDARVTDKGVQQHQVWSGDAALVNIERVLKDATASGNESLVPYPMKDGKLADGGAKLAQDLVDYTRNQNNGYKGDGGELKRPANPKGFIPDVNPDYSPVNLTPEVANFANLLMGERPPKTAIVRNKAITPVQIRAKAIADVNIRKGTVVGPEFKAPYEGNFVTDYNPLRVDMEAKGMNLKDLNPVNEWINADRVKSAKPMENVGLQPTAADVTAAGFLPEKRAVTVTGPDGKEYKATLDGIQDFTSIGGGKLHQITMQEDIPGTRYIKGGTTYDKPLQKDGFKVNGLEGHDFMPAKTEAGKVLEEQGFHLVRTQNPKTGLIYYQWFNDKGESVSSLSLKLKGAGKADVYMASTDRDYRRNGLSEALYREAGTYLQSVGVKKLAGDVFHPAPVEIRRKVFGEPEIKPFPVEGGQGRVTSTIDPNAQFLPSKEPRAVAAAAVEDAEGKIYRGSYHGAAIDAAQSAKAPKIEGYSDPSWDVPYKVGFVTNDGEFLSRDQAYARGLEMKQLDEETANRYSDQDGIHTRAFKASDPSFLPSKDEIDPLDAAIANTDYSKYNVSAKPTGAGEAMGRINPKLPNSAKGETFDLVHLSSKSDLKEVDPQFFGKGKATSTDLRGAPKSYFFVAGSDLGQDAPLFKDRGLNEYSASINGARLYDLRAGKPDKLGWRKTANRVAADEAVQNAGYDGILLDTADGRQVVATFKPVKVKSATEPSYLPEKKSIVDQLELGAPPPPIDRYDRAYMNRLSPEELKNYFPEAIHGENKPNGEPKPLSSDLVNSPIVEKHGFDKAVQIIGDKLVQRYKDAIASGNRAMSEATKLGETWYSRFVPELQKFFGKDTQLFAEFLASTSPNTNPEQNFKMAVEAYKLHKQGWFEPLVNKFNEGMNGLADGSTLKAYKRAVPASERPANISEATLMRWWVDKHDLKPTKAPRLNGKDLSVEDSTLYGISSYAVLKVAARKWMTENSGPKTAQFVGNLTGQSDGATIDVWADRTLRQAAYEDSGKPWRILPENSAPVNDADFAFGQSAFKHAADKLGIKPSALQGALWFAEKANWAEKGWSPLNLGDFMPHLEDLKAQGGVKEMLADVPISKAKALAEVEIKRKNLIDAAKELKKAEKAHEVIIRKQEKAQGSLF